ncbi:MAG: hypothetical protein WBV85_11195 [Solirubrobacteraceae bacterium]
MPRIIVTTDPSHLPADMPVWLDEQVQSIHLSTDHAAAQFVERVAWAINDAEDADREQADDIEQAARRARAAWRRRGSSSAPRSRGQVRLRA